MTIKVRNLSEERVQHIKDDLDKINWEETLGNQNCNTGFATFHHILCESINTHAPEETRKLSYKKQIRDPWIT